MNTMLELSMDAKYDVIAACLIVATAVIAKAWFRCEDGTAKVTK